MIIDRPEAYFYFFQTLQTITDMFDFVQSATSEWDEEINDLAKHMEAMADKTIEIAAEDNWQKALAESGIRDCWTECQRMMEEDFAPYFQP
jgi:hypothetical protein